MISSSTPTTSTWRRRTRRLCATSALLALVPLVPAGSASAAGAQVVQEGESIQDKIDKAPPGTEIRIRGHHVENVWINKDGITLRGLDGASMTLPADPTPNPCGFPVVVCAIPESAIDSFPDIPPFYSHLRDIGVRDLTLNAPNGDAVATIFVRGADIRNNVMPDTACNGVFAFFNSGVSVVGNDVANSVFCDAIAVIASERVRVAHNTANNSAFAGISIQDSSSVKIQYNSTTGNCIGIVAFDADGPIPAVDYKITGNTANANNTICFPFGPEIPIGATGILGASVDGLTIKNNTANDNVTDQLSITAGGITVLDSPDPAGPQSNDVLVSRNTATGNSSAAGPADLVILTAGNIKAIKKNNCDASVPDASWCAD